MLCALMERGCCWGAAERLRSTITFISAVCLAPHKRVSAWRRYISRWKADRKTQRPELQEQFTTGRMFTDLLLTRGSGDVISFLSVFKGTVCKSLPSCGPIWDCRAHSLTLPLPFSPGLHSLRLYFSKKNNIFILYYCKKKCCLRRYRTLSWQLVTFVAYSAPASLK